MSNTKIQILRSYANTAPTALEDGELAYSFKSNTLFIGTAYDQIISIAGTDFSANTLDGGSF
jgi:hypothetical protein